MKKEKENNPRAWHDTTEPEIEVFLSLLLCMSMNQTPATEDYWNRCSDKPIFISIQQALSLRRFQQIKRFLKLNNRRTKASGMSKGAA